MSNALDIICVFPQDGCNDWQGHRCAFETYGLIHGHSLVNFCMLFNLLMIVLVIDCNE